MADNPHLPYLFVSYASIDRERVLPVVDRLEAAGVEIWIDREGIHGGANYALEIAEAIEHAVAVLVMCSRASLGSRNVKQEIALAWRFEKPYLPLLLDPVEIPKDIAYWLEGSQWIELLDLPEHVWLAHLAQALEPLGITLQLTPPALRRGHEARPLVVGREREQEFLRRQLDDMLAGQGRTVLVRGEAGIGKTTLVEDLAGQAVEQDALVLWGHAYDLSVTPPYGPWLEIFRRYRSLGAGLPPVPGFVGDAEALARVGSQDTLFAAVCDFFASVAAQRPLVLMLDDLQWADQGSLDFLRFLAHQLDPYHILLVGTYRSDELHRRHPLYPLLALMVREADAQRLEVHALDDEGLRALIRSRYALSEADEERLQQYLQEHAEGNPLYAGELMRTLEDEGVLARRDDGWALGNLEQVRVPSLMRQLVEGRLGRLGEDARAQLEVAAVIGQEVPLGLWQQVSGASDEALATAVEQGQGAHLLEEGVTGESYRFRHALLREVLYEDVVGLRRRLWHRKVAEALAASSSPDPDLVAYHFEQAADARAGPWLVTAAERAQRAYAWPTAIARFESALAKLSEGSDSAAERGALLYRIAYLQRYRDPRRALSLLREARRLAVEAGETGLASRCLAIASLLQWFQGDIRQGLAGMERAISELSTLSEAEQSRLEALLGRDTDTPEGTFALGLAAAGRLKEAISFGERVLAAPPPAAERLGRGGSGYADGLQGLAIARALRGQPEPARHAAHRAKAVYHLIEHHALVAWVTRFELELIQLPYFTDQREVRARLAAEGEEAARRAVGAIPSSLPLRYVWLALLVLEGSWHEARTVAQAAYGPHPWQFRVYGGLWLATLCHRQGDSALAWQVVAELLPEGPHTKPGNTLLAAAVPLQRLAAEMALDARDLPTARAWLRAHDRWLAWSGALLGRAEGNLLWARYHHAVGDETLARRKADEALAEAAEPRQPLALIAAHRVLGRLDAEKRAFDGAEQHLKSALELAEACAAPFERALTLLELARLRAAQSIPAEARTLLDEVAAICEPLGAKPMLDSAAALRTRIS